MMTNDTSRFVRWLVIIILTAATVGMFLISMRANYLYGRGIGQTPETKEAIAWANVGADLWKGFGLIVVAALWRGGRRRAALATSLTWVVCLFFSVTSAIGIYVQERTTLTGSREAKHASYEDAKKELAGYRSETQGPRATTRECASRSSDRRCARSARHGRRARARHGRHAIRELHQERCSNGAGVRRGRRVARRTCRRTRSGQARSSRRLPASTGERVARARWHAAARSGR